MSLVIAPIWRRRLWRKRETDRLFYHEKDIYSNSRVMREVQKILPGIYRVVGPPWFTDNLIVDEFFMRRGWQ